MSLLEEKIRKNNDYFNVHEPSDRHEDVFRQKLGMNEKEGKRIRAGFSLAWKIAASIILILAIALILTDRKNGQQSFAEEVMVTANEIPAEFQNIKQYYHAENRKKIMYIERSSCQNEACMELKLTAGQELEKFRQTQEELEKELSENKNNQVMDAIVTNYQLMSKMLDRIVLNMNKTK